MSHPFFVLTPCFLFVPRSLPSVLFLLLPPLLLSFINYFLSLTLIPFLLLHLLPDSFLFYTVSKVVVFLSCICLSLFTFLPRCFHLVYFLYCSFSLPPLHLSGFRLLLTALSLSFFCPLPVLQALHLYRQVLLFILLLFHVLTFKSFSSYKSTDKSNHTCMSPHPSSTLLFFFILPPLHVCMWSPRTVATAANPISQMSRPPMKGKA